MHSRDRREFGRRKMRIRNKWEVVLVLTVIAAGIVITTVAAIKAKERREMQVENKPVLNSNKSSVSPVREVLITQSTDKSIKDLNKKRGFPLNNGVKRQKVVDSPPDYDVEYDLVKSGADEYTALASESIDSIPRNKLRIPHDGLPGFPPPMGISGDFNANVELSADAAGFVLESVDQTSDPPKDISEPKPKLVSLKSGSPKPDLRIAIPVKILPQMGVNNERLLNMGSSDSMRISLPNLEPAIRLLGLSDDFHHSSDFSSLQSALANIPLNMRRMAPDGEKQEGIQPGNPIPFPKSRSKRESERRFVLKQYKPFASSLSVKFKDNEPKTGESRYIPFNERSFINDGQEDNDSDDSETDSEEENIRPLFNFDDLENRFPSVLSSSRDHKRNDENYSTDESRNKQKYGILGSGNFEIIRGGIYGDDESATNVVPNYVNENESPSTHNDNRKSDERTSEQSPHNDDSGAEQNNEEDSETNRFSPFNLDFFTGTPVLGFQGYDNFGATSEDKFKVPGNPSHTSAKTNGQRRQFYDPFSADSNLHVIATDEDLYSDS